MSFENLPPPPGYDPSQGPPNPGFDPNAAVILGAPQVPQPPTAAEMAGAVQAGVLGALEVQAEAAQQQAEAQMRVEAARAAAARANAPFVVLANQAKDNNAPQPGDTVTLAPAPAWPKGLRPKFGAADDPTQGKPGEIRGTPAIAIGGFTRSGPPGTERPVNGIVVSGRGVIGTADEAKALREPHALQGVEAVAIPDTTPERVAFSGLMGRLRRRGVANRVGTALQLNREVGVEREAAASVVHARKPVAGLEPSTARQEAVVREAFDLVEHQGRSEATLRRNEYIIRAAIKTSGLKVPKGIDVTRLTGQELLDVAAQIPNPDGATRKAIRVAMRRGERAEERVEHSQDELDAMAAGHTPRAQGRQRTAYSSLVGAERLIGKQVASERDKAAKAARKAQRRQPAPASDGRPLRRRS